MRVKIDLGQNASIEPGRTERLISNHPKSLTSTAYTHKNNMAEDIPLYEQNGVPLQQLPADNVRITDYRVMPWPDGTRVTVEMGVTQFRVFPAMDVLIANTGGEVVRMASLVGGIERRPAPTLFLPQLERGTPMLAVVEMINIQPHTLTHRLWEAKEYLPCNLRCGIDVLQSLAPELRSSVSIKGFDADISPVPLALASSCGECDSRVRKALNEWNLNRDFDALLLASGNCGCHPGDARQVPTLTIEQRLSESLARLFPGAV